MEIWIVSGILVLSVFLLVTERLPVDLTAIGMMFLLAVSGVLDPVEAVAGFANPAVITVGAMFMLSAGMVKTGAVGFVGAWVIRTSGRSSRRALLTSILIVALASAFINNTPVVVLFIPIVTALACEYELSPSKMLIPISYASILGGTCTLIGTSTNIILSDLATGRGLEPISMFELAKLGLPLAAVGIAAIWLGAPRLLPAHAAPTCELGDRKDRRYLAELRVTEGSSLVGADPFEVLPARHPGFEVFELVRGREILRPEQGPVVARPGDLILGKGSPTQFVALLRKETELPDAFRGKAVFPSGGEHVVAELVVPPESDLLGQRLAETELSRDPEIEVIAVRRLGVHYGEQRMGSLRMQTGMVLLVQCSPARLEALRRSPEVLIVEDVHEEIFHRHKAWTALAVFTGVVVSASTGLLPIMVAALGGAFLMIVTRCVSLREAYRAVQGNILVLIAGTIALGAAMERSGAARLYAETILSLVRDFGGPALVLSVLILITSLGTEILSNNATAVLLLPIALSMADVLGVDSRPFLMGVVFGASAAFATPIGYQTNLMVYGPGGYRFVDFLKLGVPLSLMVWAMSSLLIPVIWPF